MLSALIMLLLSLLTVVAGPTQKECTVRLDIPVSEYNPQKYAIQRNSSHMNADNLSLNFCNSVIKPYEKQCGHLMINGYHIWPVSMLCS